MKISKKKIAVVSLILCLVSIVSMGSLAWFTDSDDITNTFKFVDESGFYVEIYETDPSTGQATTSDKVEFPNILPGATITKDPTVINKSSNESQYVRLTVVLDKADKWQEVFDAEAGTSASYGLEDIFTGHDENVWVRFAAPDVDNNAKTITYVFYLNSKLAPQGTATLFRGINMPTSITMTQAEALTGTTLKVTAEAIQTSNLPDSVTAFENLEATDGRYDDRYAYAAQAAFALLSSN